MSFRRVQSFRHGPISKVTATEEVTLETGVIVEREVDQSEVVLPEPELFDINNQLKAGVKLEEVNSQVMAANTVNAESVVRKYTRKKTEVNDEK